MRSHFRTLLFVLLLVVSASTACAQIIDAGVARVVWVGPDNMFYPVGIVGIYFNGQPGHCIGRPLRCSIPDNLGDDWMTKMQVSVVNRSPMAVTCVRLRMQVPKVSTESRNTGVVYDNYLATIGVIPENALRVSADRVPPVDQQPAIELKSGGKGVVPFAHVVRTGGGFSPSASTSANLTIMVYPWDVFFKDGAHWLAPSGYVRRDPNKLGTWVRLFSDPTQTPWTANSK